MSTDKNREEMRFFQVVPGSEIKRKPRMRMRTTMRRMQFRKFPARN